MRSMICACSTKTTQDFLHNFNSSNEKQAAAKQTFVFRELLNEQRSDEVGRRARKLRSIGNLTFKILWNYIILVICVAGFRGGGVLALMLPVLQIFLSWLNYCENEKWQTVLMLECHLLISTALGLYLEGYLYLRYISDDAESVLVFREIWKIGVVLVSGLLIITTLLKYLFTRNHIGKEKTG